MVLLRFLFVISLTISGTFAIQAQVQTRLGSTVQATNVVSVVVADQSDRARQRALRQAFRIAVVKMSGDSEQFTRQIWQQLDPQAEGLLSAYKYEMDEFGVRYVATFDAARMQQLLRQNNLSLWDERRPDSILWLAVNSPENRQPVVLSEQSESNLRAIVNAIAEQRGVRVRLPLYDLEDTQTVSAYDVWGRFTQPVINASFRYGIEHLIIARIQATPDYDPEKLQQRIDELNAAHVLEQSVAEELNTAEPQAEEMSEFEDAFEKPLEDLSGPPALFTYDEFQALLGDLQPYQLDYTFIIDGRYYSARLGADSPESLITELLNRYVNQLARRFAINPQQFSAGLASYTLSVSNVESLTVYAGVQTLLRELSMVDSVTLQSLQGHVATFELRLLANERRLIDALVLDGRLLPGLDSFGNVTDTTTFEWQR
ncbi:DUF2066 domain-containing protein [Alteromonas sp. ASW11-36]|uniref:DUF2066 domain-containing protein n=1 Tax=Alteromonas arenosi TaxID=3055817 RepID=A0ABT7SX50_9ALTE|nr:DUF2066 domain-containing protein [Alteromonas sp. ASW11-36]MDM7860771.1 DUF2066 domain-containing protein [Alteromonas sp. ASW11-36]